MTPLIVVPAAGRASRMRGRDKLLELVEGVPLLRRQVISAQACSPAVLVCLRPGDLARQKALEGLDVSIATNQDADEGLSASLKRAARRTGAVQPLAILLPDVPGIGADDISNVLDQFEKAGGETVVRASDPEGRPGTPVVFPPRLVSAFATLTGDTGANSILKGENVIKVTFPDDRATLDLDTPEDWDAYRARDN